MGDRILKPSEKSLLAPDQDVFTSVGLQQTTSLSPLEKYQHNISAYDVYLQERAASTKYRIYGDTFLVGTNVLCNYTGLNGYEGVEAVRNYDESLKSYEFTTEEVLKNDKGFYYYIDPNGSDLCEKTELEPFRSRFDLTNASEWTVFVTYPFAKNLKPLFFNNININDGLAIFSAGNAEVNGKEVSFFVCALTHNLSVGDKINIYNENGFVKEATVYQLGASDNTYKKNVFFIDEKVSFTDEVFLKKYRFKKVIAGYESEYYSRWYKKMTTINDYDAFKTSFAANVFKDKNYSFVYPNTIDLKDVVDHLNRPLTELYISFVKNSDGVFWGKTLSALKLDYSNINYDYSLLYEGGLLESIEIVTETLEYFFGNIVEYNVKTLLEVELNYAMHVFNTKDRLENEFYESYYYRPHYRAEIKTFSDNISKEDGITEAPDYATEINGLKYWREIELSDLPYLNKHHYVYNNLNVFIRRQDPCTIYYQVGNLPLIDGNCIDIDKNKIVSVEKIC